mmetsp:Transcript_15603/g.41900  ORF Transcript_15603/g.41900 Transcript_15603/m.41900 type:complete len:212 (+) Transcript_15603:434-1069(+)
MSSLFSTQCSCASPRDLSSALSSLEESSRASSGEKVRGVALAGPAEEPAPAGCGPASSDKPEPLARSHSSCAAAASAVRSESVSESSSPSPPPAGAKPFCIISSMASRIPAWRIASGTAASKASPSTLRARARRCLAFLSTPLSWRSFLHTWRRVFSMSSTDMSHMASRISPMDRAPLFSRSRSSSLSAPASSLSIGSGSSTPVTVMVRSA